MFAHLDVSLFILTLESFKIFKIFLFLLLVFLLCNHITIKLVSHVTNLNDDKFYTNHTLLHEMFPLRLGHKQYLVNFDRWKDNIGKQT